MVGHDQVQNMILNDAHERVYSGDSAVEQVPLGLYVIRGDNLCMVADFEEFDDQVRAQSLPSIIQQHYWQQEFDTSFTFLPCGWHSMLLLFPYKVCDVSSPYGLLLRQRSKTYSMDVWETWVESKDDCVRLFSCLSVDSLYHEQAVFLCDDGTLNRIWWTGTCNVVNDCTWQSSNQQGYSLLWLVYYYTGDIILFKVVW